MDCTRRVVRGGSEKLHGADGAVGVVTRHLQKHGDEGANPWMMTTFPFYFGCTLGAFILKHTDNLSHALQGSSMSAGQGQQVAEEVCNTLSIGIEVKPHLTSFGRGC